MTSVPLLMGEISIDVTVTPRGQEQKLRLGGIVHAARGFWASSQPFAVAAVLPSYLEVAARKYMAALGCIHFHILGTIYGAPNVTLVFDPTEVDDQEYDTLLRDERSVTFNSEFTTADLVIHSDVLAFPGVYDLAKACELLPPNARLHVDAAYDIEGVDSLSKLDRPIATILMSTSSDLFRKIGSAGIAPLVANLAPLGADVIVLKENRGGSRMHITLDNATHLLPAQLSSTVNSVGVGDVFAAAYLAHLRTGPLEAGWRATYAAAAYSQTTDPDVFASTVRRESLLSLQEMKDLGGTSLPWEMRPNKHIYLAAPDFARADRRAIERAASSLSYHNFRVRRPVQENGELPLGSDGLALDEMYRKDVDLLDHCQLLFAVPTGKDPGTLVEIGLAIAKGIPVVVYDPGRECDNTMVIAGSRCYSTDLDLCLNSVFRLLGTEGVTHHA